MKSSVAEIFPLIAKWDRDVATTGATLEIAAPSIGKGPLDLFRALFRNPAPATRRAQFDRIDARQRGC